MDGGGQLSGQRASKPRLLLLRERGRAEEAAFDEDGRRVCVDGGQHVVEDDRLRVSVNRPGERHPRLLSSGERDALLADFGLVPVFETARQTPSDTNEVGKPGPTYILRSGTRAQAEST